MTHRSHDGRGGEQRDPEVQAFEAHLAALRPREDRLNRDRLMYQAGQGSAQCDERPLPTKVARLAWPASCGAVAGAAAALLVMSTLPATVSPRSAHEAVNPTIAVRTAPEPRDGISSGRVLMAGASLRDIRRWLSTEHADWPTTDIAATGMGESVATTPTLSTRSLDRVL